MDHTVVCRDVRQVTVGSAIDHDGAIHDGNGHVRPLTVVTGPSVKSVAQGGLRNDVVGQDLSQFSEGKANLLLRSPKVSSKAVKAASVGANTVKGPSPERVSTNPASSRHSCLQDRVIRAVNNDVNHRVLAPSGDHECHCSGNECKESFHK